MKLVHQMFCSVAVATAAVAGAGMAGSLLISKYGKECALALETASQNQLDAARIALTFKVQVQEWKDVLLRGKDPSALDKHWKAFEAREQEVDSLAQSLSGRLTNVDAKSLVREFLAAHKGMGEKYRIGLDQFKAAEFSAQAGDAAVKGIDRAPAELLQKSIDAIEQESKANVHVAEQRASRATYLSDLLMLLGVGIGVATSLQVARRTRRRLGGEPDVVASTARQISQGNLAVEVTARSTDDSSVMAAMKTMRDSLSRVVAEVHKAVESVGTTSSQIAAGNQDLSNRTEQHSSSLEQTAASVERLTSSVRQSADSARQANDLASSASAAASKGGEVVRRVVVTMEQIAASSSKIAEIINVIDGISFQTNILALNAAVEAARAGEQGRGFAVVASEVRNLAQRSGQAAREIKVMIDDSVEKVGVGSQLVREAGSSMTEIVAQVTRVSDLIGEITSAVLEQSSGIGQVNEAVTQMDRVMQQNAALVEQSAAAAASLKDQSDRLARKVSFFKLPEGPTPIALDA